MSIDIGNFLDSDQHVFSYSGQVELDKEDLLNGDLKIKNTVHYDLQIYRLEDSYSVDLTIDYDYSASCDRCLKISEKKGHTSLSASLLDQDQFTEEESDEDYIFYKNNQIEIEDYVLMEINSSLPMKILCSESCKGICPICGTDLNEGSCDCKIENIDPRLEKLKDFFKE